MAKFVARKKWFVVGDWDCCIHVHCYKEMQRLAHFHAHGQQIVDLAVHPTEPYVMSASLFEGNVKLWDWEKGWECTRIFEFADFYDIDTVTFLNRKDTDTFAVCGNAGIKVSVLYHFFIQNFSQSGNIAF
jgi:coatomer subunit beta'